MLPAWVVHRVLIWANWLAAGLTVLLVVRAGGAWFHEDKGTVLTSRPETFRGGEAEGGSAVKEPVGLPIPEIFGTPVHTQPAASDLKHLGTASAGEQVYALVEHDGAQRLVRTGDVVGDWKICAISGEALRVEDSSGRSARIRRSSDSAVKEFEAGRDVDAAVQPGSEIAKKTIRVTDRGTVENILSHWADLFRDVKVSPYVEHGLATGYVLLYVRPEGVGRKLGLLNGDIVEKINGRAVTDLESLVSLRGHLDGGGDVVVDIRRGPKQIQIVYQLARNEN